MLQLTEKQMILLAESTRKIFVIRLGDHLTDVASSIDAHEAKEFKSSAARQRLSEQMHVLLNSGFEWERDVAQAIEFFELHGLSPEQGRVRRVLSSNMPASRKLTLLYRLREKPHL